MASTTIQDVVVEPLTIPLLEPFTIATGSVSSARNVLITITLQDGSVGYGESAPFPPSTGESQETALAAARGCVDLLRGQDAATQQQLDTQKALVAQLEAAVKTDEAQVAYAKVQLSYTTINAPLSGRVGARLVDPGNIVHASDANGLVVINQIDPITLVFTLPEEAVVAINRAQRSSQQPLKVSAYARDSQEVLATGKLVLLDNQINTTSGTVQLKARFDNAEHKLWPGQYVNARLQMNSHGNALTVPAAAIQRNQQGTYVYAIDQDDKANMQPVKVDRIQDGVAVLAADSGVAAGQRVVIDGQYKLKPGSRIVESKPQPAKAQGSTGTDAKGNTK